jgi:hypothetical protein
VTLREKTRADLYTYFSGQLGEALAEEFMAQYPVIDAEQLATKGDLDVLRGELRGEIGGLRGEIGGLRGEIGELRGEIGELRGEMHGEIGALRGEIGELRGEMHGEIGALRGELKSDIAHQTKWLATIVFTALGGGLTISAIIAQALG